MPGPFGNQSHQLAALRHLSLCFPEVSHTPNTDYTFLHPQHLPSLVSLALTCIPPHITTFLPFFQQCALHIRFLYINNCYNSRAPAILLPECKNLAHLCVVSWDENLYPLLTTIPTMELLSFTTSWYERESSACLTWEEDLREIYKKKAVSLANAHLYSIPGPDRPRDLSMRTRSLHIGLEWEALPGLDVDDFDDLVYWDELRLRLV